jgi:hypothetical protein
VCSAWATLEDLPDDKPDLGDERWGELLLVATEILWALSGRRWSGDGSCEATATLYVENDRCCGWWPGGAPVAGYFFPALISRSPSASQRAVKLPHDEVTEVLSVTVGGVAFTSWRHTGAWLHRTDGRGWQDCAAADVVIEYLWGKAPPAGGKRAAVMLALELGKAEVGDSSCRLPKRVVSVTRQGVSMTLLDPQTFLQRGKLGIPDIDQWLASVNPKGLAERGSVWSPDVPTATLG